MSKTEGAAKRATEGISEGYTIAFLLSVTFYTIIRDVALCTEAIEIPYEIPLRLMPCAFACYAYASTRKSSTRATALAQDDT